MIVINQMAAGFDLFWHLSNSTQQKSSERSHCFEEGSPAGQQGSSSSGSGDLYNNDGNGNIKVLVEIISGCWDGDTT